MKETGIFFYIRDLETNKIWNTAYESGSKDGYSITFSANKTKYIKLKNDIETEVNIICTQVFPAEIRSITIKN